MKLTEAMKFLAPAIEKHNKLMPILEHVHITQGYAISQKTTPQGMLAMAAPVALPLTCSPNGLLLEKAVERFGDDFAATQLPNGNLYFKSGKFEVTIPCSLDSYPIPDFGGQPIVDAKGLLLAMKRLVPFAIENDDQPWMETILVRGGKAIATCGHTFAWVPLAIGEEVTFSVPVAAVKAALAVGEDPEYIAFGCDRVVFVFAGSRFLSHSLIHTPWPSTAMKLAVPQEVAPVPDGLWQAIKDIQPFTLVGEASDTFYGLPGAVASDRKGIGAKKQVDGLTGGWSWHYSSVKLIEKHATGLTFEGKSGTLKTGAWAGDGIFGRFSLGVMQ